MVADADVLLENFAPGVMDRLGVGWDALKQLNPRLIYGSGTGYGLSGPDRDQLAMDHTIQAASGIMSATGDADRPPARAGGAPCDIMGGVHMYAGVMSALVGRASTGKGTLVEVSMLESMYFTLCSELAAYHASGKVPERQSGRSPSGACPYGRYRCLDGWIAVICVAEAHWHAIAQTIGREDLLENPEYDAAHKRKKREAEINEIIEAWSSQLTRDSAFAAMREARVPVAPVKTLDEVNVNPHLLARGMLNPMHHDLMGDIVLPNSPIRYSDYESNTLEFFPEPGAHNKQIYGDWLGLDAAEQASLAERDII
jgi:crotonobetainyl-CoA:carnitine CoA-transferase CaiB-like acyl-CoA transferase